MSNAVAVIGLTYGGTDVQQNPIGIFLEIIHGLNEVPSVRGVDTVVPGLAGRIARNRVTDVLTLELQGMVAGNGSDEATQREDFRDLVTTLRALFDPTVTATLVATPEDGGTWTIAARTLNIIWNQIVPSLAMVNIQLESVAPDWTIAAAGS